MSMGVTIWFPVYRLLEEYLQGSNFIHIPYIYLIKLRPRLNAAYGSKLPIHAALK